MTTTTQVPIVRRIGARTPAELQAWETEGGGHVEPVDTPQPPVNDEAALLMRLGAAVLGEWNKLPMPLRRAVYGRAVSAGAGQDELAARRDMARFLRDHQHRPGQA